MASIELLSSEPDLLVQIFLYLELADLTSIEDVCTEWRDIGNLSNVYFSGIRRDRHLLFEVEMYLQKGCIMVSGVGSS